MDMDMNMSFWGLGTFQVAASDVQTALPGAPPRSSGGQVAPRSLAPALFVFRKQTLMSGEV